MEYFTFPITQRPPPRSGQRFSWNSDDNDEAARIRDRLVFWGVTTHKWFTYIVRALFYSHPVSTYIQYHSRPQAELLFIYTKLHIKWHIFRKHLEWSTDGWWVGGLQNEHNIMYVMQMIAIPSPTKPRRSIRSGMEGRQGGEYIEQSSRKESGAGIATHEFVFLRFC